MIRAPLWQVAEKGKPASLKILNVQKLLGQEPTKSRVVPPAAGVTGDFKTVVKPVRIPVAIFGSLGVCIYVPASRHWLISYCPIHLT